MSHLHIVPLMLRQANALVSSLHRHHKPVRGHRFSIGAIDGSGILRGVCIIGRPVSRELPIGEVAEVTRLVTDGTKNACSFLYSAAARICREMGFNKIQTYILDIEPGTSLRAAGWKFEAMTSGGTWESSKRYRQQGRRSDQPQTPKQRWAKALN